MKNGVLVCAAKGWLKNIGDYVQSIAARQFAGEDAINMERETLNGYAGESVKLVMNGWFMHYPNRFPPADVIKPLFVSFHLYPKRADIFFSEKTLDYIKRYEPIGCRSTDVVSIFENRGVKAEFTSCLTLTLGRTYHHVNSIDAVPIFVDPYFYRFQKDVGLVTMIWKMFIRLPYLLLHFGAVRRIAGKFRKFLCWPGIRFGAVRWFYAAEFHRAYAGAFGDEVLLGAEYITHSVRSDDYPTEETMFAKADELLRRYERASFVVTSRLHCALPCIAMETPVWVPIHHNFTTGRFGGNENMMNIIQFGSDWKLVCPSSGKLGVPPIRMEYRTYAQKLAKRCEEFFGSGVAGCKTDE